MLRACPHHEYGENHLNTFFYDGLLPPIKALLDSSVGRQLCKIHQNQIRALIEEVVNNSSRGNQGRARGKGMYEVKNSESLESKLEALLEKKLAQISVESLQKYHQFKLLIFLVKFVGEATTIHLIAGGQFRTCCSFELQKSKPNFQFSRKSWLQSE